jgi:transposase
VINGILWRTRTGSPWRDVPDCYGDFRTLHGRHRPWSGGGTWETVLTALQADSDRDAEPEWAVGMDSTVVRAHRHAAGARHEPPQDVPAERLATLLPASASHTGGWVE